MGGPGDVSWLFVRCQGCRERILIRPGRRAQRATVSWSVRCDKCRLVQTVEKGTQMEIAPKKRSPSA